MSYPALGINMDANPCYFYMTALKKCHNDSLFPQTKCAIQRDDFLECHTRSRYNTLMAEAAQELRAAKVINVPTYDRQHDRFVFDDGRIVSNDDPIFKTFKWL